MKCPFRMKALDNPDTCDHACAWCMTLPDGKTGNPHRVCAVAVIAASKASNAVLTGDEVGS